MRCHYDVWLVILFWLLCKALSTQPPAPVHCSPVQEGSRHSLSKVFSLADDDQVSLATIVRSHNARAHLELAQCTINACASRLAAYQASIKRLHNVTSQLYEVSLTLMHVKRKDGRRYLWYVNGKVMDECTLEVFDFSKNVVCTPPRLLNRGRKQLSISVSCSIDMVYPKPECIISQTKDGKVITKNYISSQTLNTDHYNHTCTMTMLATADRLQEYQVVMFPEKLGVIKGGSRYGRFMLSLPEVTLKDCPQNWTKERWRDYYVGGECNLWRPESSSGQAGGDDQLCGIGSFQSGSPDVFQRFINPQKTRSCPTGFDSVGIYFDIKVQYHKSLSHVDITGFGIDVLHIGERRLLKSQSYYRIYTAFKPVPGESVAFRLEMRNPFGYRKFVECYIPVYEHCPTLVSMTTTPKTDGISTSTETTTYFTTSSNVSHTWNGNGISTSSLKGGTVTADTIVGDNSASFPTLLVVGIGVAVVAVVFVVVAVVCIAVIRRQKRSELYQSSGRMNGVPGAFGNALYASATGDCSVNIGECSLAASGCGGNIDSARNSVGCEAEYAEVGDFQANEKGCLTVALPRAEENPYETMSCRP